jgi:diketogulonate reductase-like aldo/keto reductase
VALNWVISKGAVPIVGMKSAEEVKENLGSLGWEMSPQDIAELDRVSAQKTDPFLQRPPIGKRKPNWFMRKLYQSMMPSQ